jgi:SLT domain-containing protein
MWKEFGRSRLQRVISKSFLRITEENEEKVAILAGIQVQIRAKHFLNARHNLSNSGVSLNKDIQGTGSVAIIRCNAGKRAI